MENPTIYEVKTTQDRRMEAIHLTEGIFMCYNRAHGTKITMCNSGGSIWFENEDKEEGYVKSFELSIENLQTLNLNGLTDLVYRNLNYVK